MPTLPSGRRIEFSLDRFHALLARMDSEEAREIADHVDHPDDLLFVLDAVHFSLADGSPYFAGYVAADWRSYTSDWLTADRQALEDWLFSAEARAGRRRAIRYLKSLMEGGPHLPFPYALARESQRLMMLPGSSLPQ